MSGLLIPSWVEHGGGSIYSVDIHPTEEKLATGGLADVIGDGLVMIWNLLPIKNEEAAKDENVPKVLAKLKHNGAAVNCVRWSGDGSMLACASDDKSVTIYEYDGRVKSSGTIGSKMAATVEKYRVVHSMHSHYFEVLGVAWSPDDRFLASSSMDNTVIVWNARKLPEKIVVLNEKRGGHTDAVKGIAWDPIGKYLATQSADGSVKVWTTDDWKCEKTITDPYMNTSQNTTFLRLAWSAEGQFFFSPNAANNEGPVAQIVRRKDWDLSRDFVGFRKAVTCIGVCPRLVEFVDYNGTKIRVSLVAIGSRDKSLAIFAYPLVRRPLLAIKNFFKDTITDISWRDLELAVSSRDGHVKYVLLTEETVGTMLNLSEMGMECERLYQMRPSQFQREANGVSTDNHNDNVFIETAEQLLAKRTADANKEKEITTIESVTTQSQAKKQAEIFLETRKEQVETRKDGKRRIQPIFLSSTVDDDAPKITVVPKNVETPKAIANRLESSFQPPSPKKKRIETSTTDESTSGESSDEEMETSETETVTSGKKGDGPTTSNQMLAADFKKPTMRPFTLTRITIGEKETILDMPERRANFMENIIGAPGESISVENEWKCVGVDASKVSLQKGETMVWAVLVDPPVATVAANRIITAVGCFDRSVRVFASSSGRLHCCLQLDSSPVRVGVNGGKVFALTQSGKFSSWDIEKRKAILSRIAVSDCVTKDDHLQSINITTYGLPVLSFSNGDVFTYASDLQCWQLTDSPCSLMKLSRTIDSREIGNGHIGRELNRRRRFGPLPNTPLLIRNSISETQLESWLNCAQSAGSSADFKRFLFSYTTLLVNNGSMVKIKELMARLDGPGGLCGLQKPALKKEVEALLRQSPNGRILLTEKRTIF